MPESPLSVFFPKTDKGWRIVSATSSHVILALRWTKSRSLRQVHNMLRRMFFIEFGWVNVQPGFKSLVLFIIYVFGVLRDIGMRNCSTETTSFLEINMSSRREVWRQPRRLSDRLYKTSCPWHNSFRVNSQWASSASNVSQELYDIPSLKYLIIFRWFPVTYLEV
jgi:hypothetical protein